MQLVPLHRFEHPLVVFSRSFSKRPSNPPDTNDTVGDRGNVSHLPASSSLALERRGQEWFCYFLACYGRRPPACEFTMSVINKPPNCLDFRLVISAQWEPYRRVALKRPCPSDGHLHICCLCTRRVRLSTQIITLPVVCPLPPPLGVPVPFSGASSS